MDGEHKLHSSNWKHISSSLVWYVRKIFWNQCYSQTQFFIPFSDTLKWRSKGNIKVNKFNGSKHPVNNHPLQIVGKNKNEWRWGFNVYYICYFLSSHTWTEMLKNKNARQNDKRNVTLPVINVDINFYKSNVIHWLLLFTTTTTTTFFLLLSNDTFSI